VCAAAAAGLLLAGFLAAQVNDRFSPDVLLAPWAGRFWGAVSLGLAALFILEALHPVLPAKVFGVRYWPARVPGWAAWNHVLYMTALGAAAFLGIGPLSGAYDAPYAKTDAARVRSAVLWGGVCGAVTACVGLEAGRALFVADALRQIGRGMLGGTVLWCAVPCFLATAAVAVLATTDARWEIRWRFLATVGALALWVLPGGAAEAYLRLAWDYGRPGLADAAGVRKASEADKLALVVLALPDGAPGVQRREEAMTAEGLAVSRHELAAVRRYLEKQGYQTVFVGAALRYLRRGWELMWDPGGAMDADLVRLGPRFPPDHEAFLRSILVAPATPENYGRLENLARSADTLHSASVKKAGNLFQGLSDAYARFGDLKNSNLWLGRIRKLWPLYDDDVNVDPVEDIHDGRVSGSVTFNGRPASAVQVGLFMQTSTSTAVSAKGPLVASAWPDAEGAFSFTDLTPGRYYLALRSDPILLGDPRIEAVFSPGVFRLAPGAMDRELFPIRLQRSGGLPPPEPGPMSLPAAGAVTLPQHR
ncbi:MAG: carboxypeptidase regulatory-like domain-containing protein, partial [Elusimicrobia bacterium]|nr:carboxypeptidase regulatory-like domain-containing protein [Elusimicrobiota bacterium]